MPTVALDRFTALRPTGSFAARYPRKTQKPATASDRERKNECIRANQPTNTATPAAMNQACFDMANSEGRSTLARLPAGDALAGAQGGEIATRSWSPDAAK